MAQYRDLLPSEHGWLHDLAKGEIHPEADQLLNLGKSSDPQQLIEESTVEFLTSLRENFNEFAKIFNSYSEAETKFPEIKVYTVANSAADFMMFRNQVKLIFSNVSHGIIHMSFARHLGAGMSVNGVRKDDTMGEAQELTAQVGPFRDIFWTFQGEKVSPLQVAKFYFAEFVRSTREVKSSKVGNQLLLEEVKALLKQKGLDL